MIRESIKATAIVGLILTFGGCAGKPQPILEKFLEASLKANFEEAYKYISAQDRAVRSVSEYRAGVENPFAAIIAHKASYSIQSIEVKGSRAIANVSITMPDLSQAVGAVMGVALASAFGGKGGADAQQEIVAKLAKQDFPMTTRMERFHLVRDADGWKVLLGWQNEKRLADAAKMRKERRFQEALTKLDEILSSDADNEEATKARAEIVREQESFREKEAYFDRVKLYDLKARYFETVLEKRMPGVEFKLKNTGDRVLKRVEVTTYFKNRAGDVISEEDYTPVLVSEFSFSSDNKPLKPGYIWQLERGKFYQAKNVPDEWKEGSVTAKITNIEFGDGPSN